jgi:NAD(P)H dehydrogenase (quinone)
MEASPPLSNAGPRKKTQSKVASEQALAWSGLPIVTIRPTVFLEGSFLPLTGRYDRMANGVERVTGRPAISVRPSRWVNCVANPA